jgi:hypothetical protein
VLLTQALQFLLVLEETVLDVLALLFDRVEDLFDAVFDVCVLDLFARFLASAATRCV